MGLPVEVNNLMMGSLGGYNINRSLRFRSSASAYLNRTPASAGNRKTFTWSGWVKRGALASNYNFFSTWSGGGSATGYMRFNPDDTLDIFDYTGSAYTWRANTSQVFRDPSAWYHVVVAIDTTQGTSTNRVKIYVNGVQVSAFGTYTAPTQNADTYFNAAQSTYLGAVNVGSPSQYFDGYLAEANFIDGQALTPSSFGAYDTNGVWQPKKYTGTYGTNGFYLPFSNTTSTTTLVQDSSGNGNNWTANNISLTAGTTYDSMIDSPTVGPLASNYAVLNAVNNFSIGLTGGNLDVSTTSAYAYASATFSLPSSGKWYWEFTDTSTASLANQRCAVGFGLQGYRSSTTYIGQLSTDWFYLGTSGNLFNNASGTSYGATYTQNDVIGIAVDCATGKFWFSKNGTFQASGDPVAGTGQAGTLSGTVSNYVPMVGNLANSAGLSCVGSVNFGQRPFSYTPPTGFNALNTYNLPAPSIANGAQYMAATTYTGNGTSQSITNGGNNTIGTTFAPDFVWAKIRSTTGNHSVYDSVRGAQQWISTNLTNAEGTYPGVTAFNSNGFSVGSDGGVNQNAATFVAWQWKAGGTGVTNNSGTITSTVSANPTAGFSIVTYTGTGANATVGHGLGVAPSMIIVKNRTNANNWAVYHSSLTSAAYYLSLNQTIAQTSNSTIWNSAAPTSSVFSIGTAGDTNGGGTNLVAYCFAAVSGYSAMGSYTGNGSADGPFVFTNFRPRWLLVKRTDAAEAWLLVDSSRNTYNVMNSFLQPQSSAAEQTANVIDFLSNGFKVRDSGTGYNASGGTYVWAAFCENPFKYSRGR